jgi:enoyl-CoA hydratase
MPASTRTERHEAVLEVTVDDGRANALSFDLIAELNEVLDGAESDPSVRAVVLVGRDGRFCAGFDLGVVQGGDSAAVDRLMRAGGDLVRRMYLSPLPLVAACTGHALAAGALLLLGCDRRVGPDAPVKIGLNEVAIGLALPDWALAIAEDRLSRRHLQSSAATAALYDGTAAVDAGFLDVAVDPGHVRSVALAEGERLAALDPAAYRVTVSRLRRHTGTRMAADLAAAPQAVAS